MSAAAALDGSPACRRAAGCSSADRSPFTSSCCFPAVHRLVADAEAESADLWLINSCTVKSPSQSAMDTLLRRGRQLGKALVVAGCVPQVSGSLLVRKLGASEQPSPRHSVVHCKPQPDTRQQPHPSPCRGRLLLQGDRRAPELRGLSLLGVTQIDRVVEAVEETLKGHTVQLLAKKALPRLDLPKVCWWIRGARGAAERDQLAGQVLEADAMGLWIEEGFCGALLRVSDEPHQPPCVPPPTTQVRRNRHVEILPLSTGCLGACTYCKTKHARGQLGSYALEALVARAREAAADPQVRVLSTAAAVAASSRNAAMCWGFPHALMPPHSGTCSCELTESAYPSSLSSPGA